jgi:hypothetical protein
VKVVLGQKLLAQPPAPGRETARLAGALDRHELYFDDVGGPFQETLLYKHLCTEQPWIRAQLDQMRPYAASPQRPRLVIGGRLKGCAEVDPAVAVEVLISKLAVLVEDKENDRQFVEECLRRKWTGALPDLQELMEKLEFVHGGGIRIHYNITSLGPERRRAVVVVDSDRDQDDERVKGVLRGKTAQNAEKAVRQLGSPLVELVVLDRREAENYISEEEVLLWARTNRSPSDLIEAWRRGGRWRWYFDMKKGRSRPDAVTVPPEIETMVGALNFGGNVKKALLPTTLPRERPLLDHDLATDIDRLLDLIVELA